MHVKSLAPIDQGTEAAAAVVEAVLVGGKDEGNEEEWAAAAAAEGAESWAGVEGQIQAPEAEGEVGGRDEAEAAAM
jgi:hypothetical protein